MTMVFGLVLMAFLYKIVPLPTTEGLGNLGFVGSIKEAFGAVWKPIFIIWAIMVLRSFVGQVYMTFLPIYYAREGFSLLSIGTIVSIFTVAGALSGVAAGHFSDRFGFKPVFFLSHGLSTPSLYLLLLLPGDWAYVSAFLAGFFVMASLPLGVTMAQEIAPKGKSMVSSLMMGLAWGTGGMMTPLAGKLADLFSIRPVLAVLAVIPLLSVGLIAMLPERSAKAGVMRLRRRRNLDRVKRSHVELKRGVRRRKHCRNRSSPAVLLQHAPPPGPLSLRLWIRSPLPIRQCS